MDHGDDTAETVAGALNIVANLLEFATEVSILLDESKETSMVLLGVTTLFKFAASIAEFAALFAGPEEDPLAVMYERMLDEIEKMLQRELEKDRVLEALGIAAAGRLQKAIAVRAIDKRLRMAGFAPTAQTEDRKASSDDLLAAFAPGELDQYMFMLNDAESKYTEAIGRLSGLGTAGLGQMLCLAEEMVVIDVLRTIFRPSHLYAYHARVDETVQLFQRELGAVLERRVAQVVDGVDTFYAFLQDEPEERKKSAMSAEQTRSHMRQRLEILMAHPTTRLQSLIALRDHLDRQLDAAEAALPEAPAQPNSGARGPGRD